MNNQRQLAIDIEKKKQEIANETSAHERNNLTQDLREMEATYETKQGVIDGYYNTISDYELNSVRLASGNAEEIAKIERAGELIGVAFQIQDDILDVTSTFEKLGKPINSDEKNHKVTYATMFGIEKASEFVETMSDEAIDILKSMGEKTDFLVKLTEYLIKREN